MKIVARGEKKHEERKILLILHLHLAKGNPYSSFRF